MSSEDAETEPLILRPIPGLARAGVTLLLLVTVVLFGSLYLVTIPDGPWGLVIVLQALCIAASAFWYARFNSALVRVGDGEVTERVFPTPTKHFAISEIRRLVLADVYVASTVDTNLHLVAIDHSGRRMFRMRSKFWSRDDIHRMAIEIGAPVSALNKAVTQQELSDEISRL